MPEGCGAILSTDLQPTERLLRNSNCFAVEVVRFFHVVVGNEPGGQHAISRRHWRYEDSLGDLLC